MEKPEKKVLRGRKPQNHDSNGSVETISLKHQRVKHKRRSSDEKSKDIKLNRCQVCFKEFQVGGKFSDLKGRLKITCSKCSLQVHLGCYGLKTIYQKIKEENLPEKNVFTCDLCDLKITDDRILNNKLICVICGNSNTYCQAYKKVHFKKDYKLVHVLCGLFASNINVSDWGYLTMELTSENNSSTNENKSYCAICLNNGQFALIQDVWKCWTCDKQAHYICMLIDSLINDDPNARTWFPYLSVSPNYDEILLENDHDLKSELLKSLKEFVHGKVFHQLKHSNDPFDKNSFEEFLTNELQDLKEGMNTFNNQLKEKYGESKFNSGTLFLTFCPEHNLSVCCFTDIQSDFICCDYCDTWMHNACLKLEEKEIKPETVFFCERCSDWFKKQDLLEDLSEIKTKFEFLTPMKSNNSFMLKNEIKNEEEEEKSFSIVVKKEGSTPKKFELNKNFSAPISEIKPAIEKNHIQEFTFNFDSLLNNLPLPKTRLPTSDLIQIMFFFEFLIGNLTNKREYLDRNSIISILQLLAGLPFKNHKLLMKIISRYINENYLEKEILNKLIPKMVSIYGENDSLLSENLEKNKERFQYLNNLLNNGIEIENQESDDNNDNNEEEVVVQSKKTFMISNERKLKIKQLKDITELLIKAQTVVISFHFQLKKVNPFDLKIILNEVKTNPSLEEMKEISMLMKDYKEFEEITSEINHRIMLKNEFLTKERFECERYVKNYVETNTENILKYWLERRKAFIFENYTELQANFFLNKLSDLCIDTSKSQTVVLLETQLKELNIINTILSRKNALKPENLEIFVQDCLGLIITSKDIMKLLDIYHDYKVWSFKMNIFENLRKTCKISSYILQDKSNKIYENYTNIFNFLANNISLQSSPQIKYNNVNYNLFELLSMEYLDNIIKEAKNLEYLNLSDILVELDSILKRSYLFQETLRYIYDAGVSKKTEETIDLEFTLEEILMQMEECNLFFPIYFSFENQRKKFAVMKNFFGFQSFEYKLAGLFEEDILNNYKEKALHDVYRFLNEKIVTKEILKNFSDYYIFFEKSSYKELFPYEFRVCKDLNTHYMFLINILSLYGQWTSKIIDNLAHINNNSSNNEHFQIELMLQSRDTMQEKYNEYENLDNMFKDCEKFIEELHKDLEKDSIKFDWENHLELIDRDLILYENSYFPKLIGKYKLYLWLKQNVKFFDENIKDYSKYYHLKLFLQDLIEKYDLLELLKKEVLYDMFQQFSMKIEGILEEISKKITSRSKLKQIIKEEEMPMVELNIKLLKDKIADLGLNYPIASKTINDFENCCLASKKAGLLYNMIVQENKKIDYNALKILIDFAHMFEYCNLFPSFINLKNIYEQYEKLINKVNSLKDAFFAKKQFLITYRVPNIKVHEKIIYSEKVPYSRTLYDTINNIMTYEQAKNLIEELNKVKINVKAQKDILVKYKSRTELFGKNCEKLYSDRNLNNLSESNIMEYLSSMIVSRNDLIFSDVLSGAIVNDYRCYEWTLNAITIQKGYLTFLAEGYQNSGGLDKYLKGYNSKKCLLSKHVMNDPKLLSDLYYEGKAMEKLLMNSRFYNKFILDDLNLTIQTIDRIKNQASNLKYKEVQSQNAVDDVLDALERDKNYRVIMKTQRMLLLKMNDIEQLIMEIIEKKINLDFEYNLFNNFKGDCMIFQKEISNYKRKARNFFENKSNNKDTRINYKFINDITERILAFPINLEEDEDFIFILITMAQYFKEKFKDFSKFCKNQCQREEFLNHYIAQYNKVPFFIEEIRNFSKSSIFFREIDQILKKNQENPDSFENLYEKYKNYFKKLNKDIENSPFFSKELILLKYSLLLLIMKLFLFFNEQQKVIKFNDLQNIIKQIIDFSNEFLSEFNQQKDFDEFCDLFNKIQIFYKEIGMELKNRAYGLKTNENCQNHKNQNEFIYKDVDLNTELEKIMASNEQDFINYFEPFEIIHEIKDLPSTKMEIEENHIDDNIDKIKVEPNSFNENDIIKENLFSEEFDKYMEEYCQIMTVNIKDESYLEDFDDEMEDEDDEQDDDDEDDDEDYYDDVVDDESQMSLNIEEQP